MARNVQLSTMLDRLRAEARHAILPAAATDTEHRLRNKLRRVQEELYDLHDWPFLRVERTVAMAAGQRYYDFPDDLNLDRLEEVHVYYSTHPVPIWRPIGQQQHAIYDSDQDERNDPVQAWDIRWTGDEAQMEVWPIPATNDQYVEFKGLRSLRPLVDDDDVCDLDDTLIVLTAASEVLAGQGAKDAQIMQAKAQERFRVMKGRSRSAPQLIDLTGENAMPHRDPRMIVVNSRSS